jgi:predicted restriction endonuclease
MISDIKLAYLTGSEFNEIDSIAGDTIGNNDRYITICKIISEECNLDIKIVFKELSKRYRNKQAQKKRNQRRIEIDASLSGYGGMFTEQLKTSIRNMYNNRCAICGIEYGSLDVHHIDYNKLNCNESNLIPLCKHHHAMTTFGDRSAWERNLKSVRLTR